MRDVKHFKPKRFADHMTITEVARKVNRDISWIRRLEARNKIPRARRVKAGDLMVRLWSPEQVDEIATIVANLRPGRPSNG